MHSWLPSGSFEVVHVARVSLAPLTKSPGSGLASSVVSAAVGLGQKAKTLPLGAVLGLGFGLAAAGGLYLLIPSVRAHVWLGTLLLPGCVLMGVGIERVLYMKFGYRVGPKRRFQEAKEEADRRLARLHEHLAAGVFSKERAHRLADRIAMQELFGAPKLRGPRAPYRKSRPLDPPQLPPNSQQPGPERSGPKRPAA
jgi:hypothetical protein